MDSPDAEASPWTCDRCMGTGKVPDAMPLSAINDAIPTGLTIAECKGFYVLHWVGDDAVKYEIATAAAVADDVGGRLALVEGYGAVFTFWRGNAPYDSYKLPHFKLLVLDCTPDEAKRVGEMQPDEDEEPFLIDRAFPNTEYWPHDDGFVAWLKAHNLPTSRGLIRSEEEERCARLAYLAFCGGWNLAHGNPL